MYGRTKKNSKMNRFPIGVAYTFGSQIFVRRCVTLLLRLSLRRSLLYMEQWSGLDRAPTWSGTLLGAFPAGPCIQPSLIISAPILRGLDRYVERLVGHDVPAAEEVVVLAPCTL